MYWNKKLNAIFIMHSINGFAYALISILVPVYLLKLNYSLQQIIIFYIINSVGIALFFLIAGNISKNFGLKKVLVLRLPFLFLYLFLLRSLDEISIPLNILAVINSIQVAFYWFPLHVLFTHSSNSEVMGNQVGKLNAFPKIFTIFAPLIGGLLTIKYGFKTLFAFSILLYLFSVLPLILIPEIKISVKFNLNKFFSLFKKYTKFAFAQSLLRVNEITEGIIWPIFIYLSFKSVLKIGMIGTLLGVGGILFTYLIGNFSDKYNKKNIIKAGSLFMILIWAARYFFNNEIIFYILTVMAGFFAILTTVPIDTIFYQFAKKDTADEFIIFTEFFVNLGRVATLALVLLFVYNIKISFIITALSYFYFFVF